MCLSIEAQRYDIKHNIIILQDKHGAIRMKTHGKKSCTRNFSHLYIHYFFLKDRVYSNNMTITYCSTYHMLADLFTKALQKALFVQFHEVIMVCKHIDTLKLGPPSTKDSDGNLDKFGLIKEVIKSNVETKYKNTGRKKSYVDIVMGCLCRHERAWHIHALRAEFPHCKGSQHSLKVGLLHPLPSLQRLTEPFVKFYLDQVQ